MPMAIGAAVAWSIAGSAAISVVAFTAIQLAVAALVTIGINYVVSQIFKPEIPTLDNFQRGIKQLIRNSVQPRNILYGSPLVSGVLAYAAYSGTDNNLLDLIVLHAGHPVSHYGEMFFGNTPVTDQKFNPTPENTDDVRLPSPRVDNITWNSLHKQSLRCTVDGTVYTQSTLVLLASAINAGTTKLTAVGDDTANTLVLTGVNPHPEGNWVLVDVEGQDSASNWNLQSVENVYASRFYAIHTFNGCVDQPACGLSEVDAKWTTAHRLRGIAYSWLRLHWNLDVWLTGIPQYRVRVYGKRIQGPSDTVPRWTDNWGLVVYDYLTSDFGLKLTDDNVDLTSIATCESVSDEQITTSPGPGDFYLMVGNYWTSWETNTWLEDTSPTISRLLTYSVLDSDVYEEDITAETDILVWDMYTQFVDCTPVVAANGNNVQVTPITVPCWVAVYTKSYWNGSQYPVIKARIRRVAGPTFSGRLEFHIVGDAEDTYSYYQPTYTLVDGTLDDFTTIYWDLSTVLRISDDVSGTWYVDNDIDKIRISFSSLPSDIFQIDWLSVTKFDKRFTVNGVLQTNRAPNDALPGLLSAGVGRRVYSQGKVSIEAGTYYIPAEVLTEDDLRDDPVITVSRPKSETFNTIKGVYVEPLSLFNAVPFPTISIPDLITEYGEELVQEIQLPFTQDLYVAQRIARIMLERNRQSIQVVWPGKFTCFEFAVFDNVKVTLDKLGWIEKIFKIVDWKLGTDGGVDLILQEDDATIYDDVLDYTDRALNTVLPSPWYVKPPVITLIDSDIGRVLITADGSIVSRIYMEWQGDDNSIQLYEINYKLSIDTDWTIAGYTRDVFIYIDNVIDKQSYDIRIRAFGWMNQPSIWSTTSVHTVIGKSAVPADVTGLSATFQNLGILLTWGIVDAIDLKHYELRYTQVLNFIIEPEVEDGNITDWTHSPTIHTIAPIGFIPFTYAIETTSSYSESNRVFASIGDTFYASARVRTIDSTTQPVVFSFRVRNSLGTSIWTPQISCPAITDWTTYTQDCTIPDTLVDVATMELFFQEVTSTHQFQFVDVHLAKEPVGGPDRWEESELIGESTSRQWLYDAPITGPNYFFVKAVDTTGNESVNADTASGVVVAPSDPVLSLEYAKKTIIISWSDCTTSFPIDYYIITKDSVEINRVSANGYQEEVRWSSAVFGVTAVDYYGNTSNEITITVAPIVPELTGIRTVVVDNNVLFYWTIVEGSLPSESIELRKGSVFATAEVIGLKSGTFTSLFETTGGVYSYWLVATDSAGNYGTEINLVVTVNEPPDFVLNVIWDSDFSGRTENALANDQLLFGNCFETYDFADWTASASNSIAQDTDVYAGVYSALVKSTQSTGDPTGTTDKVYIAIPTSLNQQYKGSTVRVRVRAKQPATGAATQFAMAYSTNDNGNSTFETFNTSTVWEWYELSYLVPAEVTPGNDYVGIWGDTSGSNNGTLIDLFQIDVDGVASDRLIIPINSTINYEDHFTSNSWTTPQNQIDAGFPIYIEPVSGVGTYQETFDYGVVIPSTRVTVDVTSEAIDGTVSTVTTVSVSEDLVAWVDHVETLQFLASNFRYLRYNLEASSVGGDDILLISRIRITLDSKLKNDSGFGTTSPAGARAHNNMVDQYIDNWIPPSNDPTAWTVYDSTAANLIISSSDTPAAQLPLTGAPNENLWQVTSQDTTPGLEGGGHLSDRLSIDNNKMYIGGMFTKRVNVNEGSNVFHLSPYSNNSVPECYRMSDGTLVIQGAVSEATQYNTWVFICTVLHPKGTTPSVGNETGVAGIYSLAGTKLSDVTEYVSVDATTHLDLGFYYANATTSRVCGLFARPILRETTAASIAADVQEIIAAATAIGTTVMFGEDFIDVSSIVTNPNSIEDVRAIFNFSDIPNPVSFNVFMHDASGNEVSGDFGWIARGY